MPEGKFLNDDVYQGKSDKQSESNQAVETGSFNSKCLASYKYNVISEELTLTFTDGAVHVYTGMSKDTVEALKKAPSVGKFFNAVIRIG